MKSWRDASSCVTDVKREGRVVGLHDNHFLAPLRHPKWLTTNSLRIQASQDGDIFFFFPNSEQKKQKNKTKKTPNKKRLTHAHTRTHKWATSSRPCQVANEATPSHQKLMQNMITRSRIFRSLIFLNRG